MIKLDLQEKKNEYQKKELDFFEEVGILEAVIKINEWDNLSDEEKIQKRKTKLDYYNSHFEEFINSKKLYERSIIIISDMIVNFINRYKFSENDQLNYLYRLYVLLYCEIKLINKYISYKNINHVPFSIFEPLIDKVKDTEEYKLYKLGELFEEYKKMYQLFLEKPYEEK